MIATGQELRRLTSWATRVAAQGTIDTHIRALRRKLEAGGESRLLHTIRGAGYVLRA